MSNIAYLSLSSYINCKYVLSRVVNGFTVKSTSSLNDHSRMTLALCIEWCYHHLAVTYTIVKRHQLSHIEWSTLHALRKAHKSVITPRHRSTSDGRNKRHPTKTSAEIKHEHISPSQKSYIC